MDLNRQYLTMTENYQKLDDLKILVQNCTKLDRYFSHDLKFYNLALKINEDISSHQKSLVSEILKDLEGRDYENVFFIAEN